MRRPIHKLRTDGAVPARMGESTMPPQERDTPAYEKPHSYETLQKEIPDRYSITLSHCQEGTWTVRIYLGARNIFAHRESVVTYSGSEEEAKRRYAEIRDYDQAQRAIIGAESQ